MLHVDHQNVGIAKVKLGRSRLNEISYSEALLETLAGYDIPRKKN